LAEFASDTEDDLEFNQERAHHIQGPNDKEERAFLWPCFEDSGKKLRTGVWLRDGGRASEESNDSASSPLAKKAAIQGTWVTPTSTLEDAAFVSPL
jgi:hypothetical protein